MRRAGAVLAAGAALGTAVGWATRDYRRWIALEPTGVPANPVGWLMVSGLRLRARDPLRWRDPGVGDVSRGLVTLEPRAGARPTVDPHPLPHRVLDQYADEAALARLDEVVAELAERPELVVRRAAVTIRGGGELAVRHPDGSVHVALAPLDARVVVARRWGEFHPLAGVAKGLPEGWVLLYPPRDAAEAERIGAILAAAADHALHVETPVPASPEPTGVVLGLPTLRPPD